MWAFISYISFFQLFNRIETVDSFKVFESLLPGLIQAAIENTHLNLELISFPRALNYDRGLCLRHCSENRAVQEPLRCSHLKGVKPLILLDLGFKQFFLLLVRLLIFLLFPRSICSLLIFVHDLSLII